MRRIDAVWERADELDPAELVARIDTLAAELPDDDPRALWQRGGARDSTGDESGAAEFYARALERDDAEGGLSGVERTQLVIQYGSTLRNLGRAEESLTLLDAEADRVAVERLEATRPIGSGGAAATARDTEIDGYGDALEAFRALTLHDLGREAEALRATLLALAPHLPSYQRSLRGYAEALVGDEAEAEGDVDATLETVPQGGSGSEPDDTER